MPHRVAVVVPPGVLPLDLGIPIQIFGLDPHYDLQVCADDDCAGVRSGPLSLAGVESLTAASAADTVVVPGAADPVRPVSERTLETLRAAAGLGARIVSICTGAFVLASAGILAGRTVTTHWQEADRLQRLYPDVVVDPRPLFIDDGDVLTSAGVTAGIDLCLHMIDSDFGTSAANQRARAIVAPPRRVGDQAQYIPKARPSSNGDSLAPLRTWLMANYSVRHTISDLAARAHCSPRTLVRRFITETGVTPAAWLMTLRLDQARELLESTDVPIERLGELTGLGSPATARAAFRRSYGVSPEQYRRTFGTRSGRHSVHE
ncbi:helix-turn-helix domain-containing protein [Tsukamurella sp. 8F]|uniref:GlxA family transcriptional regulator n=1 Tax=unclassified Tsukamurella TaxID=2633480 RepID=UPI0023B9DB75|nr:MULTISPECIES: helix-turn-helix domain-containing protein [unclassified Tsukamurella]MDF0529773.1 helix-turn-helix domain-containing protein [Tsukamurella sp. 8J]MDF0586965.1 helix-turn-helix domain-containing protein [Tsukamurella sp. 8F]